MGARSSMKDGIAIERDAGSGLVTLSEFVGREFVSYTLNEAMSRGFDPARQCVLTIWRACKVVPSITVRRTTTAV